MTDYMELSHNGSLASRALSSHSVVCKAEENMQGLRMNSFIALRAYTLAEAPTYWSTSSTSSPKAPQQSHMYQAPQSMRLEAANAGCLCLESKSASNHQPLSTVE
jgi:hypothetical protein